jgi:prevent-host-death family protein
MKLENITPITELKRDAAGLIEKAAKQQSPIVITQNGRATAVLQDVRSYEADQQKIAMMQLVAQSEGEIAAGHTVTMAQYRKRMDAIFRKHGHKRRP